jgi:hypothetical protein
VTVLKVVRTTESIDGVEETINEAPAVEVEVDETTLLEHEDTALSVRTPDSTLVPAEEGEPS